MSDGRSLRTPHRLLKIALSWWVGLLVCARSGAAAADPRLPTYRNTFLIYAAGATGILVIAQIADAARARMAARRPT